ncbi:hypothetical protein Gogos_022182, partial [Gossypium gossypioides]|nr:hypothetical protein [Gossypium gossypioides]
VGRRTLEVNKWLREADGSQYFAEKLQKVAGEQHNWRKRGKDGLAINGFGKGPMDMVLEEENDAIALVEGKKRQRVVEELFEFLGSNEGARWKTRSRSNEAKTFRFEVKWCLESSFEVAGGRIQLVMYRASLRELVTKCKSGLINKETSTWNRELVYNLVDESTVDRIFTIPISGCGQEDRLVWKHEGSGEYSIKSGYRALNTDYLRDSTYRSSFGEDYKGVGIVSSAASFIR